MAQIEISAQVLTVHIDGADRLWALKCRLDIPLAHVVGAIHATNDAQAWLKGFHVGGTHVPGVMSAGAFHHHGDRIFWDVHDPYKAIAIELKDDRYARLVLEVDNPAVTIAAIVAALPSLVTFQAT